MATPWRSEEEREEYLKKQAEQEVKKPRYIDANLLLEELEESKPINWTDSEVEIQRDFDWQVFKHMVGYQTVVDVEEAVRCKDCVHHGKFSCSMSGFKYPKTTKDTDFCSYGVRKENKYEQ